jgi:hypothetical protein
MNREETIAAIAVMQAFVDGRVIECQNGKDGHWWSISPDSDGWKMAWDFSCNNYRIKPEPLVRYALVDHEGRMGPGIYTEADALSAVRARNHWVSMKKFIEVLP